MFIKRSFKISLLGMALFMLLVLAGHNVGQLANLTFFTLASDGPFISPLPTPVPDSGSLAHIVLQHIAEREGVPLADLLVAHEHLRN